jgi:hypothetical protein
MTRLNDDGHVYISSDGSVLETAYRSFGYAIAPVTLGQRLVQGAGPAPGKNPSSFRAEAYGVLAVGPLLLQLTEYTGIPPLRSQVTHWIDNQSVCRRVKQALTTNRVHQ